MALRGRLGYIRVTPLRRQKWDVEMDRCNLFLASIALTFVAGCATVNTPAAADSQSGGTAVTGSRIPVRDGGSSDVKAIQNKESIDDAMRNRSIQVPSKGGM
jgi:hypothetical protein